jgi:trigger factor
MSNWTLKEKSTGDLEVTIEGEEWTKAVEKAFNKIAKNVTINGFRKGTAPKNLIEEKVTAPERQIQAVEDNANVWMRKALEENKLEPISQPQMDVKSVDAQKAVLVFTFAVQPEVKVADYKGLPYTLEDAEVSDDDFNAELNRMRETYADLQTKEGAAEKGDTVNIDYEGFKGDVAFEGGKAEGYNLELGSNSFIPGFEEKLIGAKAGEDKELNLKFPEDYHAEELKGADVIFKVKVNEVKTKVMPEIDDDFAKDVNIPNVETAEDLKKTVRERLENSRKSEAEQKADNALMDAFCEKVEVEIPDVLVDEEVQNEINQLASQIQQYGMNLNQYLSMMGKKPEDLKAEYHDNAEKTVKIRLGLEAVAKAEDLKPTEEEINTEYENIAKQYNMDAAKVKSMIDPELLKKDLCNQKAYDFVKENASKTAAEKKPAKKPAAKKAAKKDAE